MGAVLITVESMSEPISRNVRTLRRAIDWARARPLPMDLGFALGMLILTLADIAASDTGERTPDVWAYVLGTLAAVLLVWRRKAPASIAVGVSLLLCVSWIAGYGSLLATVGLPALYSLVVHGESRRASWAVFAGLSVGLLCVALFTVLDPDQGFQTLFAFVMALYFLLAAALGAFIRNWRQIFAETEQRAEFAEADRAAAAERAALAERARIAREMHDVVSHSVSIMVVQAAAGQEIAAARPDRAIETLARIEEVGRESLDEMRRMLGVLRHDGGPDATLGPQPSLADVTTAVEQSVLAGGTTELTVTGVVRPLPQGLELAGFRIVQEALTNVRKHAGPNTSAHVLIEYGTASLRVEVSDDGVGPSRHNDHDGHGLIGMRERVDLYQGELESGARTGGGFSVVAVLPIPEGHRTTAHSPEPDDLVDVPGATQ